MTNPTEGMTPREEIAFLVTENAELRLKLDRAVKAAEHHRRRGDNLESVLLSIERTARDSVRAMKPPAGI